MSTTRYPRSMTNATPAPAAPKPEPGKGAKIAGGIIALLVLVGCLIGGIAIAHSGSSKPDTKTLTTLASMKCENSIKPKVISKITFGKETYTTKGSTWNLIGNITAGGKAGLWTCALTLDSDGQGFTLVNSDVVFSD